MFDFNRKDDLFHEYEHSSFENGIGEKHAFKTCRRLTHLSCRAVATAKLRSIQETHIS